MSLFDVYVFVDWSAASGAQTPTANCRRCLDWGTRADSELPAGNLPSDTERWRCIHNRRFAEPC